MTRLIYYGDRTGHPDEVFIGRPGHFGNPVIAGVPCPVCRKTHVDKGSTLPCYGRYLDICLAQDAAFADAIADLYERTLMCPGCKTSDACHGLLLAEAARREARKRLTLWVWCSSERMTFGVLLRRGVVGHAPPIAARFLGKSFGALVDWMRHQPGFLFLPEADRPRIVASPATAP